MSIPLDRLYNFLHDLCKCDDLIIYRFFPHGSRKLKDLQCCFALNDASWFKLMTTPCMILHDQEPLMYNFYTKQDLKEFVKYDRQVLWPGQALWPEVIVDMASDLHIRAGVIAPFNAYDQTLLVHSELNSQDLNQYQNHGFIGVYFWSHALISLDWFRYAKVDPALTVNFEQVTHDFLIYNRSWSGTREYRLTFTEMLASNNLISNCKTKFQSVDNGSHYTQHQFVNKNLAISSNNLHELYSDNLHDASASADYNNNDYATIGIEVVLETLFDDCRHHLTEKILRPIACGRPFILASTAKSLQYLKQYGFKTFDGLLNETYDSILDPHERLQAIVNEMKRISCLGPAEKKDLWTALYKIAEHNKKLFFSNDFHNHVVNEYKDNLTSAVEQLTVSSQLQDKINQVVASGDPEMLASRNAVGPNVPTAQQREQVAQWISENCSNKS